MCEVCNNVHKKLLIQAAACNLALLMRALYGAGKPRAAHDRRGELISAILWLDWVLSAMHKLEQTRCSDPDSSRNQPLRSSRICSSSKNAV